MTAGRLAPQCLFVHLLRKFSMRDWGIEHKWVSVLLLLLLLYNGRCGFRGASPSEVGEVGGTPTPVSWSARAPGGTGGGPSAHAGCRTGIQRAPGAFTNERLLWRLEPGGATDAASLGLG